MLGMTLYSCQHRQLPIWIQTSHRHNQIYFKALPLGCWALKLWHIKWNLPCEEKPSYKQISYNLLGDRPIEMNSFSKLVSQVSSKVENSKPSAVTFILALSGLWSVESMKDLSGPAPQWGLQRMWGGQEAGCPKLWWDPPPVYFYFMHFETYWFEGLSLLKKKN